MALILCVYEGQKIYLMGEQGILCKITSITAKDGKGATVLSFSMGDKVEILRKKVLDSIIKEQGEYKFPSIRRKGSLKDEKNTQEADSFIKLDPEDI